MLVKLEQVGHHSLTFKVLILVDDDFSVSPPSVHTEVRRSGKPGVQKVDAAQRVGPLHCLQQGRVVMETQSLPEPMDGIHWHDAGETGFCL